MKNIVIFGAPGSGKGTQSDKIIAEFGVAHISTGDVLRAEIKAGTELGKTASGYINEGKLVPDSLIIDMLASTLDSKGKDMSEIHALIPESELYKYATDLRSKTQGRGVYVMQMDHFEKLPDSLIEKINK